MPTPKRSRAVDNTEDTMMTPSEIAALDLSSARVLINVLQQNLKKAEGRADKAWETANMEKKEALARADATVKRMEEEKQQALARADASVKKVEEEKKEALARADASVKKVEEEKKEALARADAGRKEAVNAWKTHAQQLHQDARILIRNQGKMLDIIDTGVRYFGQLENHVPTLQQTTALLKDHAEELDETGFIVVKTMGGSPARVKTHFLKGRKSNLDALLSSVGPSVMRQIEPFRVTKNPDAEINAVIEVGNDMIKHEKAKRSAGGKPRYPNLRLTADSFVWTDRVNGLISWEQFHNLLAMLSKPQEGTVGIAAGCVEDSLLDVCDRVEDISLDIVGRKTEFEGAANVANGVNIPERPYPAAE